jgi:ferric-dicitrate binding protein FerR (iron transport regulator)
MQATKSMSKTASRVQPIIEQLAENEYARENIRKGAEGLREGARALADGRRHPKRRWPKRLAMAAAAAAAAGVAIAAKGSNAGSGEAQQ